jgi:long-subunit acyl-CoA synthetase (AMP-forming)
MIVPVHYTYSAEQFEYVVQNADVQVLLCDETACRLLCEVDASKCPTLKLVVRLPTFAHFFAGVPDVVAEISGGCEGGRITPAERIPFPVLSYQECVSLAQREEERKREERVREQHHQQQRKDRPRATMKLGKWKSKLIEMREDHKPATYACTSLPGFCGELSDVFTIIYTSGSTGTPKGVAHSTESYVCVYVCVYVYV